MDSPWFPDRKLIQQSEHLVDLVSDDFDQQVMAYRANIETTQISPGPFYGRLLEARFGPVEFYVQYKSQSLKRLIKRPPDRFTFRVLLDSPGRSTNFGVQQDYDAINVQPPSGEGAFISDAEDVVLSLSVDSQALQCHEVLLPEVGDWLAQLGPRGADVASQVAADSLRHAYSDVFELLVKGIKPDSLQLLGQQCLRQIASSLSLAWVQPGSFSQLPHNATFERFQNVRDAYLQIIDQDQQDQEQGLIERELSCLGSKRSIEVAFKASVGMGPMQYWRLIRLHNARRKLLMVANLHRSIGDIAAEDGFWDQSKFGLYYKRLFGERPSDTRKRLDPDVLSRYRSEPSAG